MKQKKKSDSAEVTPEELDMLLGREPVEIPGLRTVGRSSLPQSILHHLRVRMRKGVNHG